MPIKINGERLRMIAMETDKFLKSVIANAAPKLIETIFPVEILLNDTKLIDPIK